MRRKSSVGGMQPGITEEQRAKIGSRRVVASVSGGKDSAALSLWLTENGIDHDRVYCDVGWDAQETLDYIAGPLEKTIGPIEWLKPKRQMIELILHKGMFPSRLRRFCTQELKVRPIIEYFSERLDEGVDCVNAVGLRWGESKARSTLSEWEWNKGFDAETWRPLLAWSSADVVDTLKRHGLPLNPLYLMGASRVGCWPCIFSRKEELRFLSTHDPERIDLIEWLEGEVAKGAEARAASRGETLERPPTFFQSRSGTGACIPIREMVLWSKTTRGGKQFELIAAEPEGCMRWGLYGTEEED